MNPTDRRVIAVFGASKSLPGEAEYSTGIECGRLLATAGFAVATGGYGGLMEAVCKGAAAAGGPTIGVTAPTVFPRRAGANEWVQHEIVAEDLVDRIRILGSIASGYVALPGSLGTLAELVVAWNLALVAPFSESTCGPIVTVGETWQTVVPMLMEQLEATDVLVETFRGVDDAMASLTAKIV